MLNGIAGSLEGAEEAGTRGLLGIGRREGAEKAGRRCSREESEVVNGGRMFDVEL